MAAMDPLEEKASSQQASPVSNADTLRHMASFLTASDLGSLCTTRRHFTPLFGSEMANKKKVSKKLLPHVYSANPRRVEAFFAEPGVDPKCVLTQTNYNEGYFRKKWWFIPCSRKKEFVRLRHRHSISPLQLAAIHGDNTLVINLLAYIIRNDHFRLEALRQLRDVLNREDYLAPIKNLITAYRNYLPLHAELNRQGGTIERWELNNQLWAQVGECHKALPPYVLQEFFNRTPLDPLPEFNREPDRDECHLDGAPLDLDNLGLKTGYGLLRGNMSSPMYAGRSQWPGGDSKEIRDFEACEHLFALRKADLENIVTQLQTRDTALTLVFGVNSSRLEL